MFVKHLSLDEWHDRADHGGEIADPTFDQAQQAIAALDGKQKTMAILADQEGGDHYMIVAGQWDGRYLVNATTDNVDFFSLVDPSRSSDKRLLYVGGQNGWYEDRKCVTLECALEATKHFYETGEMKSTMNWASDY